MPIKVSVSEFLLKPESPSHSRAMGGADPFDTHFSQSLHGFLQLFRGQEIQVGSADDGIESILPGFADHIAENVDDPRVRAAKKYE